MEDKKHILIVDDDDRIRNLLSKYLRENNFYTSIAKDGEEALIFCQEFIFDLIIVDIMMPKIDGYQFSTNIRSKSDIPIMMLTAMNEIDHRIKGFTIGINDYLAKPFDPRELLFRIKNILNQKIQSTSSNDQDFIRFGNFKYNLKNQKLFKNSEIINLTSNESKLLSILIENSSKIISREELSKFFNNINERSIDVQIIRLRNKIETDSSNPYFLQTIRGKGYIFHV